MSAKQNGFTFKQFHIDHHRCAMKVGTDGILLGAWADLSQAERILDLGTGTGLIALMLAQRSTKESEIHAVELDQAAYLQAQANIHASPWAQRVHVYQQDAAEFCRNAVNKFDLIVANPPYFPQGVDCATPQRDLARYTATHRHVDWLNWASHCLSEQGKISMVLPFEAGETLLKQSALYCIARCEVITKKGKAPQRLLLTFSLQAQPLQPSQLIIYDESNRYHPDFIGLTKDFYLAF
ncbi:tRNA1(Val) (adenine(37)-N6)-methyltransferase [Pasteurella multocida]|uniref:tRNA1(Val) (adenine(37)-N6)-methyltransferase n=1 Tax=Pasteurella multocida TaxID=747 RepID=UPI0020243177|nr:tRNA1(Val) (adenine(37)-N6)-methyltransferase [Pasteurella multocida]MDT8767132.1 tRNA1(Val) (adenine(37)-N6)-methyltransferase [Pasteurella multocida]URJ86554.1 tRNA1(Val) (adenine(37)-N6)-methyltransferase [Pasteurella multocida]URJ88537.1 tRNA1(Val) (adenine(37)-N6)-methyltransferase [Pasteurella multocida]HDR0620068.1 tRNA1(Val) (adenine(37)-N6)-methyltransferase [Pasteurella multocida]HED4434995.1 tRNA1(Val) (adenine(37)-N6)-methyltransferase [Pasteurella multocida]